MGTCRAERNRNKNKKQAGYGTKRKEQAIPMDIPDSGANPNQMQSHHAVFFLCGGLSFSIFFWRFALWSVVVFFGHRCKSHACR
jgi:hypothetical protein